MNNILINEKSRSEWIHLINEWIHNEEDRILLKRRLLDGVPFDSLADEVCLSVCQTKARLYKAQKQLFKHIK